MTTNTTNYVKMIGLEDGELRRLMTAITDLCTASNCYVGKVAIQDSSEEDTLLVDVRKLIMVLEDATATVQENKPAFKVSKDQLAFDF
jgi:hypothetical protein